MSNPYDNPYNQDPDDRDSDKPYEPFDQQDGYGQPTYGRYGQSPQEPGGYPTYGPQARYGYAQPGPGAGAGRRLFAYVIDRILVSLVIGVVASLTGVFPALDPAALEDDAAWNAWMAEMIQTSVTVGVLTTVVFYLYAVFMQTTDFSTVGKRLLGIRVTELNGAGLSLGASAKRNAWVLTGLVPGFGGLIIFALGLVIFVQAGQGDRSQGLNDRWARTRVLVQR